MHQLEVRLPKYEQKRLFAWFEIVFTALAFQILEHRRLIYADLKYYSKDTGEKVYSPALKSRLRR